MKITKIKAGLRPNDSSARPRRHPRARLARGLVLVTLVCGMFGVGCELIVDFDRTRIPFEGVEASSGDATLVDTGAPTEAGTGTDAADAATTDADAEAPEDDAGDGGDGGDAD